ncbi:MAG: DUF2157 domain-containing protein [Akkermansia sp.]|nr:DUF2157 domain-containing protein [Akkermansia sp.]
MKQSDIDRIAAAGLITPEQQASIIEHFHLNAPRHRRWLLLSLCGLAGALILAGIIMLISANWQQIPDLVKMGTGMVLLAGFWAAWFALRNGHPLVAEVCGFLGAGMWLADISLYGQIFQLQNPFVEGVLLFFCGVAAIPFLVRQRLLIAAVAVASYVLLIGSFETSPCESWLSFESFYHALPLVPDYLTRPECEMLSAWALTLFWFIFAELCATRGAAFFRSYGWLTLPATLLMGVLFALCSIEESDFCRVLTLTGGCAGAGMAVLALLLLRPKYQSRIAHLLLGAMVTAVPLLCCTPVPTLCSVCLTFGFGVLMMLCGSLASRVLWVNAGSLLIAVAAIRLFADVLGSYTESGLVLIAGGVLLLLGALVLEKSRRRLVSGMAQNTNLTPAHE